MDHVEYRYEAGYPPFDPDPAYRVRDVRDEDIPALARLLHAANGELGEMGLYVTAVDQTEATAAYRAAQGQCWVTEHLTDGIVATLTASMPPSKALRELSPTAREPGRAWINQMAVAPAHRGRGLVRDLFQRAQVWALGQEAWTLGVDTAVPAVHLVRLYTGWGFEPRETVQWPGKTYPSVVMVAGLP